MIRTFKNKTAELDVVFKLNSNSLDMVKFTVTPLKVTPLRTGPDVPEEKRKSVTRDTQKARSFEIYVNAGNSSGTNYRNVADFVAEARKIVDTKEGQLRCKYERKVDSAKVYFAFGVGGTKEFPSLNLSVWYGGDTLEDKKLTTFVFAPYVDENNNVNIFDGDVITFLDYLRDFSNETYQLMMHLVVENCCEAIKDSLGKQIQFVVADAIQKYMASVPK